MPGLLGRTRKFFLKYNFTVNIGSPSPGPLSADFASCSEIAVTTGEATLWQGGSITPYKEPTRLTFTDITLERGVSAFMELYSWLVQTSDAMKDGSAFPSSGFKKDGFIMQRDRNGFPLEQYLLFGMWVKEYSAGEFNNDSDEFRIERIVVAYDYFQRLPLSPL